MINRFFAAALIAAFALAGCDKLGLGDNNPPPAQPTQPMTPAAAPAQPAAPSVSTPVGSATASASGPLQVGENGMPILAKDEDLNCVGCHTIDSRLIGPPWREVAKRYKGAKTYKYSPNGSKDANATEYPLFEGLVTKVSKGGHGNWGTMPMPANDPSGKKKDRIERLVHFILDL